MKKALLGLLIATAALHLGTAYYTYKRAKGEYDFFFGEDDGCGGCGKDCKCHSAPSFEEQAASEDKSGEE